jgi:hypothetical protein
MIGMGKATARIKYKLTVEVDGEVYDVGTLQAEPSLQYLWSLLGCVSSAPQSCASAKSVKFQALYIQASGGYPVAYMPSQSGVGTITLGSASVSLGSFSMSFSATLNNSSLSGSYTITSLTLAVILPNGSTVQLLINLSNANITAQNGSVMNVTLSGSVSVSGSGVTGGLLLYAFTEFWSEVLNAMGYSTGGSIPWTGSGNAVLGFSIGVFDTSGNQIGNYNSSTSSGTNISSPSVSVTQSSSGLGGSVTITFTFTAPSTDQLGSITFNLQLNYVVSSSTTCPSTDPLCSAYSSTGVIPFGFSINVPQNIGGTYTVNQGSSYQITISDSVSISTST